MAILRIEHKVPNFDGWKQAFENDPIGRRKSGVKRYRVYRPTDDASYVIIDLEFDTLNDAQTTLAALYKLWNKVDGTVIVAPQTRLLDLVEFTEY
jgi:hypothetical protein